MILTIKGVENCDFTSEGENLEAQFEIILLQGKIPKFYAARGEILNFLVKG